MIAFMKRGPAIGASMKKGIIIPPISVRADFYLARIIKIGRPHIYIKRPAQRAAFNVCCLNPYRMLVSRMRISVAWLLIVVSVRLKNHYTPTEE
tara:strand:+ start:1096 stop:1377 length:282 start_codon:yes stop_codon:yes gene_type:complete